jgi:serine phosphatase RsbU (regulator of sigma subunit)
MLLEEQGEQRATALLAVVDLRDGTGSLASAGHPPPLLLHDDAAVYLEPRYGPPLGAFELPYEEVPLRLRSGDIMVLYSDGLTEARRKGELFGAERLRLEVLRRVGRSPRQLAMALRDAVLEYAGTLSDDVEILAIRFDRLGDEGCAGDPLPSSHDATRPDGVSIT